MGAFTSKPSQSREGTSGDHHVGTERWACAECTFLNHSERVECGMCETPRKTDTDDAKEEDETSSEDWWTCPACQFAANHPESLYCGTCDTARPVSADTQPGAEKTGPSKRNTFKDSRPARSRRGKAAVERKRTEVAEDCCVRDECEIFKRMLRGELSEEGLVHLELK